MSAFQYCYCHGDVVPVTMWMKVALVVHTRPEATSPPQGAHHSRDRCASHCSCGLKKCGFLLHDDGSDYSEPLVVSQTSLSLPDPNDRLFLENQKEASVGKVKQG